MPIDSKEKIFRELMEQYGTDLLRLCCMYLRDYQLAEDAVQDTFIIVNYAWNTPVNLEIDIAISPEQLNGFTYDFLGYYEFVEQYTSVQGWKVNVIGSVGAESYHLMFTADGIRYHLYGGAPLYRLKDVVDSME